MVLSLTSGGFKPKLRSHQIPSMTSCLPMTAPSMLLQKLTCNKVLTCLPRLETTLASQSVQRRLKLCTSQPQEKTYTEPNIIINGQQLNVVDKFTYLGSTLSRNVVIDDEVNARLAKASAAFGRLHKNVWNRTGITLETKIKVYWAIVLITLLYGCELWMVLPMPCQEAEPLPHHLPQKTP